ncbi:CHAT domain-containing protein [Peribacillus frigoritolerans]|uniref:CHAT domain-containing protein n=1 Tax=Peribacillus frigoritolerans TaxID=450367 RepID=UPI0039A20235
MRQMIAFFLEDFSFFSQYNRMLTEKIIHDFSFIRDFDDNSINHIEKHVLLLWEVIPESHINSKIGLRKKLNFLYLGRIQERIIAIKKNKENLYIHKSKSRDCNPTYDRIYNYYQTKIAENHFSISHYLYSIGLIGEAWEWSIKSLDIGYNKDFQDVFVFFDFTWDIAISFFGEEKRRLILQILANYFSISSILGHNFSDCHTKYAETKKWLKSDNKVTDIDVLYLISYYSIFDKSFEESNANEVYNKLDRTYRALKKRDIKLANLISYYLACSNTLKRLKKDTNAWINKFENTKSPDVNWEVTVNMDILSVIENDTHDSHLILNTIYLTLESIYSETQNLLLFSLQKQKYSFIIIKAVRYLLNINDYETAIKVTILWKTYNSRNLSPDLSFTDLDPFLIVIPTYTPNLSSYLYFEKGVIHFYNFQQNIDLIELTKIKNNFEQKWTFIVGQDIPRVVIGDNPKDEYSNKYEESVISFYRLDKLSRVINNYKNVNLIEFVHQNNPIVPLLNTLTNSTFSYMTSRTKKPLSKIKKVLIWCDPWGENPILYGHREKDALLEILKKTNISFDCYVGGVDDLSYKSFYKNYTSDEYDLIWLICHGKYDYDNPTQSLLYVCEETPVPLGDIINQNPIRDSRRLLFLNACQSSVSEVRFDGMNFTGIGTSLTDEYQSVMGHLWEVESFAASYFAPILFYYLINSTNWTWALKETQKIFSKGNFEVYQFLKDVVKIKDNNYLEQIISPNSEDFSKLIYFGSAVLYE